MTTIYKYSCTDPMCGKLNSFSRALPDKSTIKCSRCEKEFVLHIPKEEPSRHETRHPFVAQRSIHLDIKEAFSLDPDVVRRSQDLLIHGLLSEKVKKASDATYTASQFIGNNAVDIMENMKEALRKMKMLEDQEPTRLKMIEQGFSPDDGYVLFVSVKRLRADPKFTEETLEQIREHSPPYVRFNEFLDDDVIVKIGPEDTIFRMSSQRPRTRI